VRDLIDLLTTPRSTVTLDRAALDIARVEYPDLDPVPWLGLLDSIAAEVALATRASGGGQQFVEGANQVLFGKWALRGDERDYYDVRNSCLNDVLTRRRGIPITLSVIYLEIGRRLGRPVYGIGLPSHFVVQYDDGEFDTYIDPFHCGELLTREECVELVVERTGAEPPQSSFLPCGPKQIALRMLQNLKGIHVRAAAWEKALQAMGLILASSGSAPEEYKQRAAVQLQLGRLRAAAADLDSYLRTSPPATDREEVTRQIEAIHRYLASRN
jgi:regulator of sirC expression with transglutaminase-like and TPR domain